MSYFYASIHDDPDKIILKNNLRINDIIKLEMNSYLVFRRNKELEELANKVSED